MPSRTDILGPFDLENVSSFEVAVPEGCDEVRFQSRVVSGDWTDAEFVVEWSLTGGDDANWVELDEPLAFTSADLGVISGPRYLGAVRFLRVRMTADQSGTAGEAEIVISADATALGALRWRESQGSPS